MNIFATDLDGTLLNNKHVVSEENKKALAWLKENDYNIIFASGRVSSSVDYIMKKSGLKGYIVANNGAIVLDEDRNIIQDNPLDYDKIKKVTALAQEEGVYFHMYDRNTFYSNKFWQERVDHLLTDEGSYQIEIYIDENIIDHIVNEKISIYKVQLTVPVEKQEGLFRKLNEIDGLYIAKSGDTYIEVMDEGVNKWQGIQAVIRQEEKSAEKIVAIGDFDNDIPMISGADIGIAMGNANDNVKSMADYITLTNEDNGFARAVEYIIK